MFTGIIIATGRVLSIEEKGGGLEKRGGLAKGADLAEGGGLAEGGDLELAIDAAALDPARMNLGDSVSVQGCCLTVTRRVGTAFHADVSRETLSKTTLGDLRPGSKVNLEPSLRAGDALGGHLVSGHVDAVGRLTAARQDARSWRLEFELPAALMRFVAPKGSICIDGVSLTVNEVGGLRFDVNIIPHTREATTLGDLVVGAGVNIEIDTIARYLDRLLPNFAGFRAE
ncbi:MAG TPA: riboflavin synthase [Steroidobacteraceae bacterium]|nr:riboflavin synthase [Steroidobacteraceae bacterium]